MSPGRRSEKLRRGKVTSHPLRTKEPRKDRECNIPTVIKLWRFRISMRSVKGAVLVPPLARENRTPTR
ncbi:hypothetical protein EYF80_043560 [Liparis tanakae]|uniref:Uncharacterized protein n=1 Tax=Liparis tanakae TaxID=230148 RepID=A0A4Z2FYH2_9TELE|nr:hypothetical protein EYF80_043560 [Liparis tanakae]